MPRYTIVKNVFDGWDVWEEKDTERFATILNVNDGFLFREQAQKFLYDYVAEQQAQNLVWWKKIIRNLPFCQPPKLSHRLYQGTL